MPLKRNRVLECDSEKKRQRQTNSKLTVNNLNLVQLATLMHRIIGMEGCFNLKPPQGEDQPLPPAGSKFKIVISGQKLAKKIQCVVCSTQTNQENI
jgi:hypothetical protein